MTLKQLEYFLAIAETGNMTQAAKNLHISQPPLSLQLKALEEELGVQLFERDKKNLIITKRGKLLQEKARQILGMVNEAIYDVQTLDPDLRVTIRLGTITSVCNRILPGKIIEYNKNYPHVDFQIFEGSTTSILDQLDSDAIDLGIIREPFNTARYHYTPVLDQALTDNKYDYFVAIAKPQYFENPEAVSLSLCELKDKPMIIHRRYQEMLVNACRQKGFMPYIICQNNDIASSLSWAAAGIGIALVPYTSTMVNKSPDLMVKSIIQPRLSSRAYMVWKKDHPLNRETENFIKLIEV